MSTVYEPIIIPPGASRLTDEDRLQLATEVIVGFTLAHMDRFKYLFEPSIIRNTDLSMPQVLEDLFRKRKIVAIPRAQLAAPIQPLFCFPPPPPPPAPTPPPQQPAPAKDFTTYYTDEEPKVIESTIKKNPKRPGRPRGAPWFYAVAEGREPAIYRAWAGEYGAHMQVRGYYGAVHKKFRHVWEAVHWMRKHGIERPMCIEKGSARYLNF